MLDYEIAPYLELKDYKAPKGVKSYFVNMNDGKKIRLIYWKKNLILTIFVEQYCFSKDIMNL